MLKDADVTALMKKAKVIRKLTIDEIANLGAGHIGGAMSIVELLTILYHKWMKVDPKDPMTMSTCSIASQTRRAYTICVV